MFRVKTDWGIIQLRCLSIWNWPPRNTSLRCGLCGRFYENIILDSMKPNLSCRYPPIAAVAPAQRPVALALKPAQPQWSHQQRMVALPAPVWPRPSPAPWECAVWLIDGCFLLLKSVCTLSQLMCVDVWLGMWHLLNILWHWVQNMHQNWDHHQWSWMWRYHQNWVLQSWWLLPGCVHLLKPCWTFTLDVQLDMQ